MRISVILFSLLFYPLTVCRATYAIPENIYKGYGYAAGVDSINAAVVNPANLYLLNREEVSFILVRPVDFYSFLFGVPLFKDFYLGLGFLSLSPQFQQFRAGFSLLNSEYIKLGVSTGIDRERGADEDRAGFALSPGATLLLLSAPAVNFNLILGVHCHNLFTINNFQTATNFSRTAVDTGLRMELFIRNLFLNLGGDYDLSGFRTSVGLEYLFLGFINFGAALLEGDRVNFGFTMNFKNHFIGAAFESESYSLSYTFSLNNLAAQASRQQQRRQVRHESRVSPRILIKQRQLMDEGLKLYREKQYEKARAVWRKVVSLAPSTDYAKEARSYIDRVNSILKSIGE